MAGDWPRASAEDRQLQGAGKDGPIDPNDNGLPDGIAGVAATGEPIVKGDTA
eukprot:CAMPEP_0181506046 /NCGR_PEP_ID=MMETSP1110-20121109/58383_1 /TAXON_ID=174948 /ORGANISM="Symbiodinium sp., Strain CCMP421" /LENGTH=51 /DNA_ID=CAMNT_0023635073 /DNA_START=44 /DNA_END=199 /DNA_ORIENTATION=+